MKVQPSMAVGKAWPRKGLMAVAAGKAGWLLTSLKTGSREQVMLVNI